MPHGRSRRTPLTTSATASCVAAFLLDLATVRPRSRGSPARCPLPRTTPAGAAKETMAMTTTHPRAGQDHRTGRSPADRRPRARQAQGGSLGAHFKGPSGTPFGARPSAREENPLSAPRSARKSRRHNPLLSSLLSVVEEIIGFRGARTPFPAGRGQRQQPRRRSAGGRSRATRESFYESDVYWRLVSDLDGMGIGPELRVT